MRRVLKWIFWTVVLLGLVLAVLVGIFSARFDPNAYKQTLQQQFKKATGRVLQIKGKIALSYYPWLGVVVNDVSVGNPIGFREPLFAKVGRAEVSVKLLPLLGGNIVAKNIELKSATIHLITNKAGQNSWAMTAPAVKPVATQSAKPASTSPATRPPGVTGLQAAAIEITNGKLIWDNKPSNQYYTFSQFNFQANHVAIGKTFPISLTSTVSSLIPSVYGQVSLKARVLILAKQQAVQLALDKLMFSGKVAPLSPRKFQQTLSAELQYSFVKKHLQVAHLSVKGNLFQLQSGVLNQDAARFPHTLSFKAKQIQYTPAPKRWLVDSVQMTVLQHADRLSLKRLLAKCYDGELNVTAELSTLNPSQPFNTTLRIKGMQMEPVSRQFSLPLSGELNATLQLKGQLKSQQPLLKQLFGDASLHMKKGALLGFNIPQFIRSMQSLVRGQFPSTTPTPSRLGQATEFGELSATFNIGSGRASTDNIKMISPWLRILGEGTVNLTDKHLNMALVAQELKHTATEAEAKQSEPAIRQQFPFKLKGTYDKPLFLPDVKAMLDKRSKAAINTEMEKQLEKLGPAGKKLHNLLDKLF